MRDMATSFATEVKNELARKIYERPCCQRAEMAALLRMGATITFGMRHTFGLNFTSKNAAVARKVLSLFKMLGAGIYTEITVRRSRQLNKNNNYSVRVRPAPAVTKLLERLEFIHDDSLNMDNDRGILRKKCCQIAYLRGAFQGGGTVNKPESSYHLEMVTVSYALGNLLYTLLKNMGFPVGITDRKEYYIVYLKEGDAVIDFLAMIEASDAAEAFEIARNVKEVREQVNRLVNCETANLQKAVDAAGRQIEDIRALEQAGKLDKLQKKLKQTVRARLENPEMSLTELAQILGISKSGLNHRMRALHAMALKIEEGK